MIILYIYINKYQAILYRTNYDGSLYFYENGLVELQFTDDNIIYKKDKIYVSFSDDPHYEIRMHSLRIRQKSFSMDFEFS